MHRDNKKDLTIFTAVGELTFVKQIDVLRDFYAGTPTANVLWDMRNIEGSRISSEELEKIIIFIKRHSDKRPPGKTALVSTNDLDFGLSMVSYAYAENENLPWKIRPFRSMDEAIEWINGK